MKWQDKVLIDFSKNRQLQTERLQLRPMTIEDLTDYHEYTSDEEVLKFDYFPHKNLAESELSLVKWNLSQPLGRYGIELLSEGKLIGNASLRPTQERVLEIGYTLNKDYWQQGFGTEVVCALCQLAFDKIAAQAVQATVIADNHASIALLKKCGFQKIAQDDQANNSRGEICLTYTYELKSH